MRKILTVALLGVSAVGFSQNIGDTYIIEPATPGINVGDYTSNGMSLSGSRVNPSSAFPELTTKRKDSAYCTLATLNKTPKFTPTTLPLANYRIEYCYPNVGTINAVGVTYTVQTADGATVSGTIDQTLATVNTWVTIGGSGTTFELSSTGASFLQFDTSTANGGIPTGSKRFHIDAVKFTVASLVSSNKAVEVDGVGPDSNPAGPFKTLAAAVAFTNALTAGDNVIDITADSLPFADNGTQIVITSPVTINGDGNTNSTPADIGADAATIDTQTNAGNAGLHFLEIACSGTVTINNLNIHTNGGVGVSGIGVFKPSAGVGNYTLNNVKVSGSAAGAYLPIDTSDDQHTAAGTAVWNGEGAIILADVGGAGAYNASLNNCHAGVTTGDALQIDNTSGYTIINGGAYAHTSDDAVIEVSGTGVTFTGSDTNRVRAFFPTGAEVIAVNSDAVVDLMEYVDAGLPDAAYESSAFALLGGKITTMRFCRGFVDSAGGGAVFYASGAGTANVSDSTFHGNGSGLVVSITSANSGSVNFTDCIFTSDDGLGELYIGGNSGPYTFTNCALPTDGKTDESLRSTLAVDNGITYEDTAARNLTIVAHPVSESPNYQSASPVMLARTPLQAASLPTGITYNYSDAGAGNPDFLRPGNSVSYTGAATGPSNLSGGAGGSEVPVSLSGFTLE